ncbi:hypothetical protein V3851_16940 [Paenibacillus sp. M1]|uniref:ABC-type transport system involved in multi-copper enzyme maturation, permease component n=1 Tax=Paenibacillus haidiansis TaxID=1574488 RepID=A0ABU7VVK2_9BACL
MNKWHRQFRFELGMLFRNPWLLALPLLFAALNVWNIGGIGSGQNLFSEAYSFHAFVHTMTLGVVMLLGILAVRRDLRRLSYEWSSALPVSYATKVSAKYAAGMLYLSLFTLAAAAVFAWYSAQRGVDPGITREFTAYFAVTYEVSYLVTLALAMLLAIAIPNRVVYLIGFCAWMFGTFFMDIFLIDKAGLNVLRTFHLSRLFLMDAPPSDTWGLSMIADELLYSRLFVLSFALLLLVAGVAVLNRIRPTKHRPAVWAASGIALLLSVLAFLPYAQIWQQRYAAYEAKLADPSVPTVDEVMSNPQQSGDIRITDYDLRVQRERKDILKVEAKLSVSGEALSQEKELKLTLNRSFQIREVRVGGDAAAFTREGDRLRIELPAAVQSPLQVELSYSGTVTDYAPGFYGQGSMYAFVKGDSVFLPGYIAWYPLAGYQPIYVKETETSGIQLGHVFASPVLYSAHFRLSFEGFERPLYTSLAETGRKPGSQTFEGEATEGLTLFGGEFKELEAPDIPVRAAVTPYSAKQGEEIMARWSELYDYFTGWVDHFEPHLEQWLFLPNDNYLRYSVENETYVMTYVFDTEYAANMLMNQMLLGSRRGDYRIDNTKEDVRLKIRGLMWYLYLREKEGFTDEELKTGRTGADDYYYLLQELYSENSEADPDRLASRMINQVGSALDDGKAQQVKDVLNYFYDKGIEVPDTETESLRVDKIPYSEWETEWKKVMGDEDGH